jgi:hypothetical protein
VQSHDQVSPLTLSNVIAEKLNPAAAFSIRQALSDKANIVLVECDRGVVTCVRESGKLHPG